jgi:TonB family protein
MAFIFYYFAFRKGTNYSVNRAYLVSAGIISLAAPFLKFSVGAAEINRQFAGWLPTVMAGTGTQKTQISFNMSEFLTAMYLVVAAALLCRFILSLLRIVIMIKSGSDSLRKGEVSYIISKKIIPFSFFNFIFLPDNNIEDIHIDYILAHEKVHIKKFHSVDRILAEIILIIQWFNPFAYFFRKEIALQHELEADSELLSNGLDMGRYINSLVEVSGLGPGNILANNFNSMLKRRLQVIGTRSVKEISSFKTAVSVFFIILVVFTAGAINGCVSKRSDFNAPVAVYTEQSKVQQNGGTYSFVEKMPAFKGGEQALISYINQNLYYPEIAKRAGVEGRVIVVFVITKEGKVAEVKLLKGIGAGCDEAAMNVLKNMPDWEPGMQAGVPVNVKMTIPISFKLKN